MRTLLLATLLGLSTLACAQTHDTGAVQPGIYELEVERDSDACSPSRAVGAMGAVAVLVDSDAVDAPVPEMDGPMLSAPRVRLDPNTLHAETNRRITDCGAAFVHEEWTVVRSGEGAFDLLHLQEWQGLAGCDEAPELMPGAPEADCTSERTLRYTLESACAAPCSLRLVGAEQLACVCD
ncbi:MAG: hypothetical protein AB8I08_36410 [Sandaracinaceae bacterium]